MASDRQWSLTARYVFPLTGPPIAGGVVTVRDSKIVAVGTKVPEGPVRDLGNVAILPGLVNAHTHLEFSDLDSRIGTAGIPLADWIPLVIEHRRTAAATGGAPIVLGLDESLRSGVTALGEIATADWPPAFNESTPTAVVFRELIGPTGTSVEPATKVAEDFLSATRVQPRLRPALSPHAPYTVHTRLLSMLVDLARRFDVPLAMHVAESRDEIELIERGTGRFREVLGRLNAWDPAADARYPRILDYLEQLARAPRALVIHGNYLNDAEAGFLAAHADRMALVYCPRTHAFFRHETYPLARWLAAGVALALGTDSRASNPDLNLFEEMRFVAARHPQVAPATVLELGSINAARALGLDDEMGSLAPGKLANFAVVGPLEANAADPHELLFDPGVRVLQTWMGGELIHDATASGLADDAG